ncbi:hypothetical protein [Kitasatospora aureofaciens]|uniref:hypothetical protein n=1 Tax=Kitasatospora aureofaciens TaxID=1894 RepID=UPI00381D8011
MAIDFRIRYAFAELAEPPETVVKGMLNAARAAASPAGMLVTTGGVCSAIADLVARCAPSQPGTEASCSPMRMKTS